MTSAIGLEAQKIESQEFFKSIKEQVTKRKMQRAMTNDWKSVAILLSDDVNGVF